jgi:predicted MFS family arabinose efflux permease
VTARVLIAIGVGAALADASVVTLALPQILVDLDTTVEGVAAVLGVYTLVLAAALLPAESLRRRYGSARFGAAGFVVFAVAGIGCGAVDALAPLLALRALQALGGAAGLVSGFALLTAGEPARARLWTTAAILGTAAGPALGGALTELFDWRAIFLAQAPIGCLAAVACVRPAVPELGAATLDADERPVAPARRAVELGPALALALVSAALSGVLFLLVLLLVSGWSISPLAAAAAVTVLPAAALVGMRIPGDPRLRAIAGCGLVGAGVLALAFLTTASVAWTLLPQVLAGVGMGLALTSLVGPLLPERTPADTALVLAIRHGGITLALLLLAPVTAAQLDSVAEDTRERGAALVLDAELPPLGKLDLAGAVTSELDPVDPRETLSRSLDASSGNFAGDPEEAAAFAELARRADETLVEGIDDAFGPAFLVAGALALLGALALVPGAGGAARRVALPVVAAALAAAGAQAILTTSLGPERVAIADPCGEREPPNTGGIDGLAQDVALGGLDRAACEFGSSREELAIALVDDDAAAEYEREHGVDPRSIDDLIGALVGL